MTIRDNILFGLPMDEERYVKTIESCELESDLEIFPAGDLSQIGEKGINLSGGQKARISLARAVYHNADIILMDDVISALDAHVKRSIFDNVICGMLEDKTRILVTHSIDLIHPLDTVMLMKEGRVIARDTYENLKDHPLMKEVI
jgi:ATP-binding cassette subfamily C (CFTR/MRP) protein 1